MAARAQQGPGPPRQPAPVPGSSANRTYCVGSRRRSRRSPQPSDRPVSCPRLTGAEAWRTLPALVRGDLEVVGEDDRTGGELGLVDLLELPDRGGGAVSVVRCLVGELEEVDELGRVALLLPCGVDPGAGLMLGHVPDELHDGRLDLVHRGWVHLVVGGLVDGHDCPPWLVRAAQRLAELRTSGRP